MTVYLIYYRREGRKTATVVTAENLNKILEQLRCVKFNHRCDPESHRIQITTIQGG